MRATEQEREQAAREVLRRVGLDPDRLRSDAEYADGIARRIVTELQRDPALAESLVFGRSAS